MYKILIDHTIFLHQRNGGISKYFSRLYQVNKKFKNGVSLNIFCPITINENLYNIRGLKNLYFFKINKIPKFCTQLFYFINNLLSIIYVNINKPDLLHISYFNYQITKFTKIPYVLTIHDLIHEKYFKKKVDKEKFKLIHGAKKIICVSHTTMKDLIKFYKINPTKIKVIHHGVKKKNFLKKKRENFILFVGDRRNYKNFNLLLNAFSKSNFLKKNFKIIFFGGGKFNEKELKKLKQLKIYSKVKLLFGDDDVLNKIYRKSKVLVYPSKYEGFGIPLIEAMINGCAIIANDIQIFREILEKQIFLFKKNNSINLKNKLEKLLKFKKVYNHNLYEAKKLIKNYDLEKNYLHHKNLYLDVIEKK